MATDAEITQLWNSYSKEMKEPQAIITLYRLAEDTGKQAAFSAMEKELLLDANIEKALRMFGWARQNKASTITTRAVLREVCRIAMENVKK